MRPEKQLIVEDLKKQVGSSPFVILTEYKGMTVQQFGELRKRLRAAKAEYHVAKNTMLRHAMKAAELPELDRNLGPRTPHPDYIIIARWKGRNPVLRRERHGMKH